MRLLKTSVYVGPNIFEKRPLVRMTLELGKIGARPVVSFDPDLADKVLAHIPGLERRTAPDGGAFAPWMRASKECSLALLMAHAAAALQEQVGVDVAFAHVEPTSEDDVVEVLFGYLTREIGVRAGDIARLLLLEIFDPDPSLPFHIAEELEDFAAYAQSRALGPSAMALVKAAEARGIPWLRLNDASLIQLGQGKHQKRIEAALTNQTSHIAVSIAKDKELCARILRDLGLPAPEQIYVRDEKAAVRAARELGYPVVVKPIDGNHGRGVSLNLQDDDAVREAFEIAKAQGSGVIVERMIEGFDHRLLVVNGRLIAAAKRVPAHVIGDGKSTIAELVEAENRNPLRGDGHENMLTKLQIDAVAKNLLKAAGYTEDSKPAAGEQVFLKATANLSTGGTAIDVTDIVHPENRLMAERAVKAIGLDIGGIDFLTNDITQSYRDNGGAICEVNAGPGVRMHVSPSEGQSRDVGGAIIDMLFPPGSPSHVPIAALTGTNGKTTTARMLAHVLKMAGRVVGQTSTDAVMIDGNVTVRGDMTGPVSASIVLRDPDVDIAVLETARGGIVRAGLGYQTCDVGAVLNVTPDHLGLGGVQTLEDLARIKRLIVEVAQDTAVLNADDIHTLKMAEHSPAKHLCYITRNPSHPLVREHIRLGKRAVVLEPGPQGDQIVLYDNANKIALLWTHVIPATLEGKAMHNVENAMFAAGMAHALGLTPDQIRAGLRTFNNSFFQSPGRMNIFDEHGFRVILDYGHNHAAIVAMVDLVERLNPKGKRIVSVTSPGDRRDEDVRAVARALAGKFDLYLCHTDDDLRGREPLEVPNMLRDELIACGCQPESVEAIGPESLAIDRALTLARPDDLVLLFCAGISKAWKKIIYFKPDEKPPAREAESAEVQTAFDAPAGFVVIKDDRGVRLVARD